LDASLALGAGAEPLEAAAGFESLDFDSLEEDEPLDFDSPAGIEELEDPLLPPAAARESVR